MSSGVKVPEEASYQDEEQASIVHAEKPTLEDAAPLEEKAAHVGSEPLKKSSATEASAPAAASSTEASSAEAAADASSTEASSTPEASSAPEASSDATPAAVEPK